MVVRQQQTYVTVDELVLRGFLASEREAVAVGLADGMRRQLSALAGAFEGSTSIASRRVPTMRLQAMEPRDIGSRAGSAVVSSIRR